MKKRNSQVWTEFDEFFSFKQQEDDGVRDDTKGQDIHMKISMNLFDLIKGCKHVNPLS